MKILMVNKFLYPRGGAETYMLQLGGWLSSHGHEVEYFGMDDPKNTVGNKEGLATSPVDFHRKSPAVVTYPARIVHSTEARRKIETVIARFQPDVVHFNNINFQLTPTVVEAVFDAGIPCVQTVHDLQMLCPNHLMFDLATETPCEECIDGDVSGCIRKKCIHGSAFKSIIGAREARYWAKRHVYQKVDRYVCPSRFIEGMLLRKDIYRDKTIFIRNFAMLKEPDPAVTKGDYILFFGRLSAEKGLKYLLQAMGQLPDIPLVIAGGGPLEEGCRNAADAASNISFVGFKTGSELDDLIQGARFSIYPSVWYENCPMSILESQALGTPVVASSLGGIPELIEDGKTGVIVDDIKTGLPPVIRSLYDDTSLLQTMSDCCLRSKTIDLDGYGKKIEGVYRSVIEEHRR